jgi:predicted RecA/RadA family phage recombinase
MKVKVGDRIEMTGVMPDDPAPMEVGAGGVVTGINESIYSLPTQIYVDWDNGRSLILLESDPFKVVGHGSDT